MDVSRTMGINRLSVEFKDMNSGLSVQRTFADVVFIDRTNSSTKQMCYIMKNDIVFSDADVENFQQGHYNFDKDDFLAVGEVISINKSQKFVMLQNQNSISYNHLVIASGSPNSMIDEFIAGLNTLVDAIRVRKKIPSAFANVAKTNTDSRKMKSSKTNTNDLNFPRKIENVKKRKMTKQNDENIPNSLNNSNKRLYEVQI